jgi:hypothetical protein
MSWTILYSITDEKTKVSTTEVKLPGATTFADAEIFAGQMASLIDTLIEGAITRIGIVYQVDLPAGIKASANANSDVEEGARFQFRTANGFFSGCRLATFGESRIVAGSKEVDTVDTDVAAFVTAMVTGIDLSGVGGSGVIQPSDARDEDLTALEFAREQFLSSRGS